MSGKIKISNRIVSLKLNLNGGCIDSFIHNSRPDLNLLNFSFSKHQMKKIGNIGAPFRGHFICCPYWGSAGPLGNETGPLHGPFAAGRWKQLVLNTNELIIEAKHKNYGLSIQKKITLHPSNSIFKVEDTVQNLLNNPVPFNLVQHPSLQAPFLDEHMIIYSNAEKGITQDDILQGNLKQSFHWPMIKMGKKKIDLSKSIRQASVVASFIIPTEEKLGWVVAYSSVQELLFGYCWLRNDYHWLNIWKQLEANKTIYTGLEFGTTGVHLSLYETMQHHAVIWNCKNYELLAPKANATKSYWSFILPLKGKVNGVKNISYNQANKRLIILPEMGKKMLVPLF